MKEGGFGAGYWRSFLRNGGGLMRVYIAGALSSKGGVRGDSSTVVVKYIQNLSAMCKIASLVRRRGHSPYVPGLDLLMGLVAGDWEEGDYRGMGMGFLEVCDAVLVISDSWGVQQEIGRADRLHIPVYFSLEDIPNEPIPRTP